MAHCEENACFVLVAFVFLVQARASSICHECTNVGDIGLCLNGTRFCGINENCYVRVTTSTNQKQFTFGCMPVAQCATPVSTHTLVGRRASTQICEECCPGDFCNTATCEKAHAPWGQWSVWATCSKTCGGGTQTRTRSCNNAASGSQCVGDSKESRPCGVNSCPVKRAYNCGGLDYHTTDNGVIVSHGGFEANHHYGKNMDCIWRIEAPVGQFVALGSESFDVEDDPSCSFDYLTLYDGNTTTSPSLGKFCGNSFNTISSTGRFLTLQFITDGDTQQSGFKLFYNFTTTVIHTCSSSQFKCANDKCINAVFRCDNDDDCGDDSDEQNCNGVTPGGSCGGHEFTCGDGNCVPADWLCDGDDDCNDNTDEIQSNCNSVSPANSRQCGATNLTGSSGEITSPNYPATYPSDSNCIYYIQADPGTKTLAFKFDDRFGLEADTSCSYDYVSIYTDNHSFNHGPFCGNVSPGQLTIPGDHAYVEFVSDDSDNYSGFRVDWKALQ